MSEMVKKLLAAQGDLREARASVMKEAAEHITRIEAERIVSAAIRSREIILSIPAPKRHSDIMFCASRMIIDGEVVRIGEQGFLTSTGRFVNRVEAKHIAIAAGQLRDTSTYGKAELFSEDVW